MKPPPDIRRCTRRTPADERCRSARMYWPQVIQLPNPQSCRGHLTDSERAAYADDQPRREVEAFVAWELPRAMLYSSDPACWSWEPFTLGNGWREWHQGRCAICGGRCTLVEDHDHKTGMMRGLLCRSCNTLEGLGYGGVWERYRRRNPALICGVRERYWNPFLKEFAEPAPPPPDPWTHNPMKGIGL